MGATLSSWDALAPRNRGLPAAPVLVASLLAALLIGSVSGVLDLPGWPSCSSPSPSSHCSPVSRPALATSVDEPRAAHAASPPQPLVVATGDDPGDPPPRGCAPGQRPCR